MSDPATIPTISYADESGVLVELIHDRTKATTALAVRAKDGSASTVPEVTSPLGERLIPYSAKNNLIVSDCVLFPSDIGDFRDVGELVAEVTAFLHRYVDLSPVFEETAAYYVLLTWVYDAFNELPYLRFRGDFGTGKTRALLAVGSLCYKPFFASGASTVSPIFHVLNAFGGTLVLDEADLRFSDATAELTKILNNGNMRGLPILRTMTNRYKELNPTAFRVFGPKIIAMRERFADDALESRLLTEETGGRTLRSDIPIHLPDALRTEATELRNKLLGWRFAMRDKVGPKPERLIRGARPRTNQVALSLLSIIDDPEARQRVADHISKDDRQALKDRASTIEGMTVAALVEALGSGDCSLSVSDLARRMTARESYPEGALTPKRVGWIVRDRLRLTTTKSSGVYVIGAAEWQKVAALAQRYGIPLASSI